MKLYTDDFGDVFLTPKISRMFSSVYRLTLTTRKWDDPSGSRHGMMLPRHQYIIQIPWISRSDWWIGNKK